MDHNTATHSRAAQRLHLGLHATPHRIVARRRRILARAAAIARERERVAAAFRALANGVDAATAATRTTGFYRASGMDWARCLG